MSIRDKRDLRFAYEMMKDFEKMKKDFPDKTEKIEEIIAGRKREIRTYLAQQEDRPRYIKADIDGYIELIEIPDVEDTEEYFDENIRIHITPSAYDCTGRPFTRWHKIFTRQGKTMCYHSIGYDV